MTARPTGHAGAVETIADTLRAELARLAGHPSRAAELADADRAPTRAAGAEHDRGGVGAGRRAR